MLDKNNIGRPFYKYADIVVKYIAWSYAKIAKCAMTTSEGYAHPEYLVDAAWVEAHKDDADVVIIDCDVEAGYNRGHIPGAALVPDNPPIPMVRSIKMGL